MTTNIVMQTPTQEEISKIVDEVVRRVTSHPAQSQAPVAPSQGADCGCHKAHPATAEKGSCSCPGEASPSPAGSRKDLINTGACRIGDTAGSGPACGDLAPYIDHTLLKANATESEVIKLCEEARKHGFASVCVNTSYVDTCARLLAGSPVKVCCVVGFPLGAMSKDAKAFETRDAVARGAQEIDMVVNVGKLVSGAFDYVMEDIQAVVKAAHGNPVKVILETSLLNDDQKIAACVLSKAAGAQFVKTSTGFGTGGATADDIRLMRRIVGDEMGVKASGGIRDCNTAQEMVASGATRLGASASVGIVRGQKTNSTY